MTDMTDEDGNCLFTLLPCKNHDIDCDDCSDYLQYKREQLSDRVTFDPPVVVESGDILVTDYHYDAIECKGTMKARVIKKWSWEWIKHHASMTPIRIRWWVGIRLCRLGQWIADDEEI